MKIGTVVLGSASLVLLVAAVAQTAPPPGTAAQRKANQQARIAQAVKSGQLTAHEAQGGRAEIVLACYLRRAR